MRYEADMLFGTHLTIDSEKTHSKESANQHMALGEVVGRRGRVVGLLQAPASAQVSPQRRVGGRYRLGSNLGSGGMGEVWSAYDELLNRPVALKGLYLHPEFSAAERENLRNRSLSEARAAARIASPTAVAVYDVLEDNQRPWIVMELVNARSLAEVIRADGPLPLESVARVALAMLEALEAAHAAGVVHRDVKPANVLLATDGRITLTDFGVATLDGDPGMTATGMVMGSPAYMAPERAQGLEPTAGMDLWGLGATLFAAVEGKGPFSRKDALTTLHAVLTEPLPAMERAGVLTPLLLGLLERDTTQRLTAGQARQMVLQLMRGMEGTAADANRVPETDISDLDTASLRVLTELPESVRNKPPLDIAPSSPPASPSLSGRQGKGGKAARAGRRGNHHDLLRSPISGRHQDPSRSILAVLGGIAAVAAVIGLVWFGMTRLGGSSTSQPDNPSATARPVSTPSLGPTSISGSTASPNPSLVPSAHDGQSAPLNPPTGYQILKDPALSFAMDLPAKWKFTPSEKQAPNSTTYSSTEDTGIVQVQKLAVPTTVEEVIADTRRMQNDPSQVPGFSLISSNDYFDAQRAFHIDEYTWVPDKVPPRRVRQILVIKPGEYAYSVMLSTATDNWSASQRMFTQMIRSFRVLPS